MTTQLSRKTPPKPRPAPAPVLLSGDELLREDTATPYESARAISTYLLMHYGTVEDAFERPHHPLAAYQDYPRRLARALEFAALRTGTSVRSALDVGCNVGGVSHALAGWVRESVLGIDLSPRAVRAARVLAHHGAGVFAVVEQGPFTRDVHVVLPATRRAQVRFDVGDACDLASLGRAFDAVVMSNVLDRVADPAAALAQFTASADVLRRGGLLMVACPWSWRGEFSGPHAWLGCARGRVTSGEGVKRLLSPAFDLVMEEDHGGVLRHHPREHEYFESHVTVWKKR